MIPHAAAIDRAFGRDVWEPFTTVTPIVAGVPGAPLSPVGGSVRWDWAAWPRCRATIELPTDVTPTTTAPPVAPWGDRVAIDVNLRIARTLYTFRAATLDVAETDVDRPDGRITVGAVSYEARVNEDRYTGRDATPAGTSSAVIVGIVRRTLGAAHPVSVSVSSDPTLAVGAFPLDGDVWPTVEAIADQAGFDVFFSEDGTLVIRDVPDKGAPAVNLTVGNGGTLTGYGSRRRWAHNRVGIVYTEATGSNPGRVVGLWEDTNPASATRVGGPYGRHTRVDRVSVDAGKLPSQANADRAARAVARRAGAGFRVVDPLRAIPCPWVLPGDTARVVMLGGLTEDHLVASIEWPLSLLDVAVLTTTDDRYTQGI